MTYLSLNYNKTIKHPEYQSIIDIYENKKTILLLFFNKQIDCIKTELIKINKKKQFEIIQLEKNDKTTQIFKNTIIYYNNNNNDDDDDDTLFLLLTEKYNKSNQINNFIKSFINIIYKNNIISTKHNLVNYCQIQKLLFNYKQFYLDQINIIQNKNKTFNNQLKNINITLHKLSKKEHTIVNTIYEIRLNKIKYYKNMNNDFYNKLLDNISLNIENDIKVINKSFFFDSNDIYLLIKNIKMIKKQKDILNKEKNNLIIIKKYYNSEKINLLLSSIKKINQNNNINNNIYKLINNKMKNSNCINITKHNYPIIIQNKTKFKEFTNLINLQVFQKQIQKMIIINKEMIIKLTKKENKLKEIINELESIISLKKHNFLLYNNHNYYKTKLNKFEKTYFKKYR